MLVNHYKLGYTLAIFAYATVTYQMHYSYPQLQEKRAGFMDINNALSFVAPKVRDAAIQGAAQLESLGLRHALAGGLAVGAHGYVRATTAVDFLVGEEAFEHHGALVTFRSGVPIEVDGVRIDYLSPFALGKQLEDVLDNPLVSHGLAVVPAEALIYMKLRARRRHHSVMGKSALKSCTLHT